MGLIGVIVRYYGDKIILRHSHTPVFQEGICTWNSPECLLLSTLNTYIKSSLLGFISQ